MNRNGKMCGLNTPEVPDVGDGIEQAWHRKLDKVCSTDRVGGLAGWSKFSIEPCC